MKAAGLVELALKGPRIPALAEALPGNEYSTLVESLTSAAKNKTARTVGDALLPYKGTLSKLLSWDYLDTFSMAAPRKELETTDGYRLWPRYLAWAHVFKVYWDEVETLLESTPAMGTILQLAAEHITQSQEPTFKDKRLWWAHLQLPVKQEQHGGPAGNDGMVV